MFFVLFVCLSSCCQMGTQYSGVCIVAVHYNLNKASLEYLIEIFSSRGSVFLSNVQCKIPITV